jgi:carbamoyl-phosphate synthase large subunit
MGNLNILTSNLGALSAYGFIRGLRKIADKIILIYPQEKPTVLAHSKYIDKSYHLQFPKTEWERGVVTKENNIQEEEFIQKLLEVCLSESINIVIPTCDKEVYLFSKNKDRFEDNGITVLVSEFNSIEKTIDKYELIQAAKFVGFPYPETYLPNSIEEATEMANKIGYPVITKPRTGTGSNGVQIIYEEDHLKAIFKEIGEKHRYPMIQEYIPGDSEPSINIIMDNEGNPVLHFSLRKLRYVSPSRSTCVKVIEPLPEYENAVKLAKHLGLKGFIAIQTKYDIKTNTHKLIEINARWGGNAAICIRIGEKQGLNPLHINIQAFKQKNMANQLQTYTPGVVGFSLIEDLLAIQKYFKMKGNKSQIRDDNPLPKLSVLMRSYYKTYFSRKSVVDYYTKALIDDPKVAFSAYRRLVKLALKDNKIFVPWGEINREFGD